MDPIDFPPLPEDLSAVPDEELSTLHTTARERAEAIVAGEDRSHTAANQLAALAEVCDTIGAEQTRRSEAADALARQWASLGQRFSAQPEGDPTPEPEPETEPEPVVAAAPARAVGGAITAPRDLGGLSGPKRQLNASLAAIQEAAPATAVPQRRNDPVIVAAADIPGYSHNQPLTEMGQVVEAMRLKTRTMAISRLGESAHRVPIAQLTRTYQHNLNDQSSNEEIHRVLTAAADPSVMVAAGGWCAPAEISYDMFNIACVDGLVDLPTIGINRGGLRFPTTASFADVSALPGAVWTWTNTQDTAAATGTAQSGTKPCVRVPCPAYNQEILDCDGLCVTVGNLTSDAFPELVANHIDLVQKLHAHYINGRVLAKMALAANSTAVTVTGGATIATSWGLLQRDALQAVDYREKFGMCKDDVMEAVFPRWALEHIRADLAKRTGVENMTDVSDAMIAAWFNVRNIRTQWVGDWQVRASGLPGGSSALQAWPTADTQFLIYAPGTFVRGNGLKLDLGVVRDSVLNSTNDF